jgi:hypothetical protein
MWPFNQSDAHQIFRRGKPYVWSSLIPAIILFKKMLQKLFFRHYVLQIMDFVAQFADLVNLCSVNSRVF